MNSDNPAITPTAAPGSVVPSPPQPPSPINKIFFGRELRAGWRLAIFLAIVIVLLILVGLLIGLVRHQKGPVKLTELTPQLLISQDAISFGIVLLASFIMSKVERRKLGAYGLAVGGQWLRNFGLGILWGFVALSALLGIFAAAGDFHVNSVALQGSQLFFYPLIWGFAFLLVGLSEEFTFRGYPQYTLSTGMGFWPSAILFSLLFGYIHHFNSGEKLLGLVQVVTVALFFCFTLWRTGTLWFAVGFHAGWDWAQTCFWGTSDSGLPGAHHLLNSSITGQSWFSGGTVGPEGSALNIPLDLLLVLLFYFAFKKDRPYPDSALVAPAVPVAPPVTTAQSY
jgi:membrane protease YdiL (CAAX protease family)